MKKKIITTLLIIFVILLTIFGINTIRKFMIIKDLQNKVAKCEAKENIYSKVVSESAEVEKFIKDDVEKIVMKKRNNAVTIIQVIEPHERRFYTIAGEQKILHKYKEEKNPLSSKVVSFVDTTTWLETLRDSVVSKIYTEKIEGKDCYVIDSLKNTNAIYSSGAISLKIYLNKETGLAVKAIETVKNEDGTIEEWVTTYEQKFDVVTDNDMKEPDTSEFTIQEETNE